MLDAWVARGFVVVQTDYEGEGTPGIHPYFVGTAAGRDLTDLVRAARALDSHVGTRWVAMGHSEGGHAALFTAAVGPGWAPELTLVGAVALAPASHITAALLGCVQSGSSTPFLPLMAMMIQGMAVCDPELHLEEILSPRGLALLPDLQKRCTGELVNDDAWATLPASHFFRENADIKRLETDFLANEPGALHLQLPILILQGEADDVVEPKVTTSLNGDLCQRGARVQYRTFPGEDHDSVMDASLRSAEQWVDARFQGEAPPSTCR
jgi:pimeloyl-ACP methyl ester carboxylesterase